MAAGKIACWLPADNIAGVQMYNPGTGVFFDGIISGEEVNKNSGAESTIEALISVHEAEQNPILKEIFLKYNKHRPDN